MQTAFNAKRAKYLLGMETTTDISEAITLIPTETIEFGRAVKRGTVDGTCSNPAVNGTSSVIVGVTTLRQNDHGNYLVSEEARIKTKGTVAVEVLGADTVVAGDSAFMIVDATNFGKWTKTAGSNTVNCSAKFQTPKDGNLAVIKFDIVA